MRFRCGALVFRFGGFESGGVGFGVLGCWVWGKARAEQTSCHATPNPELVDNTVDDIYIYIYIHIYIYIYPALP